MRARHRYEGRLPLASSRNLVVGKVLRFQEEEYAILTDASRRPSSPHQTKSSASECEFSRARSPIKTCSSSSVRRNRSGLLDRRCNSATRRPTQDPRRSKQALSAKVHGAPANVFALGWRGIDLLKAAAQLAVQIHLVDVHAHGRNNLLPVRFVLALDARALIQFDVFLRLPAAFQYVPFGPKNWIYLGAPMAVVKVLQ